MEDRELLSYVGLRNSGKALGGMDRGESGLDRGLSMYLPGSCLMGVSESVLDAEFGKERERNWLG